jgi:hypothetical protein
MATAVATDPLALIEVRSAESWLIRRADLGANRSQGRALPGGSKTAFHALSRGFVAYEANGMSDRDGE